MDFTLFGAKILINVLFWSNLTSLALMFIYISTHMPHASEKKLTRVVLLAKACFSLAFLLIELRDYLPEILDTDLSHTLLIFGSLCEAYALLMLIQKNTKRNIRLLQGIAITAILLIYVSRLVWHNDVVFTAITPFTMFLMFIVPSWKLILSRRSTKFKRFVGAFYVLFTSLLLPRGFCLAFVPGSLEHPSFLIQTIGYTALVLLVVFSLSAFLLLLKEDTDRQIQKMAQIDSLTGINNRQHFFALVLPSFARHQREEILCSVIFMDIDNFKQVNDTYGHAFGDEVIVRVASILKSAIRDYDICCRYGGEEFAAFIDSADMDIGRKTAERIRTMVESARFPGHPDFACTISIGVATCTPDKSNCIDDCIAVADEALYEAKKTGRNKVVERVLPKKQHHCA